MSETTATRLPPEIVFVPPPSGPGMPRKRIVSIVTACIFGGTAGLVLFVARGMPIWAWALTMGSMFLVISIIVAVRRRQLNTAHQALRQRFLEKRPTDGSNALVAALRKVWKQPDQMPKIADVRMALREGGHREDSGRATIVCFGEANVPEVGALHFEPEIVTPTAAVWRDLVWLVIAGVLFTLYLLDYLGVLPAWVPITRGLFWGFGYFLLAGVIVLAVWVWRGMIRPTYIRMAPGVMQVLQYRYARPKPIIRSYPMEAGTLAVFTRIRKRLILTLSRGEHTDVLLFSRMQHTQQRIEQAWQALLSTVPTPPLSEDELVG